MSSQNRSDDGDDEEEGIKVAIRMRPLNQKERENAKVWKVLRKFNSVAQCTSDGNPVDKVRGRNFFTFDKVFGENSSTKELYDGVVQGIVESVVGGVNGTIFAYGQTSSGKTYTMQGSGTIEEGSSSDGGIVHMATKDIFSHINNDPERVFLLRVSFVEIYNEEVRDLLVSGSTNNTLKIREDPTRGVFVDATENIVTDFQSLLSTLFAGEKHRAFASTAMNERSSRSHTIFRITVESRLKRNKDNEDSDPCYDDDDDESFTSESASDGAVRISTLNLVDLAGSESVRHTGATGDRLKEGGMINQSLMTLSQVISKLGSSSSSHINFRDSKLTRLLQPSLSGNARMAVICCATSSELYLEETRSTLQFASRAKLVKTRAQINEVMDDRSMIKKLQRELAEAKRVVNSTDNTDPKRVQELQSKATHAESIAMKAEEALNRLKARFLKGGMLSLTDQVHDRKRIGVKSVPSDMDGHFTDLSSPSLLGADKKRRRKSDGILPVMRNNQSPLLDTTKKMNITATLTPAINKNAPLRSSLFKNSSTFQLSLLKEALSAKSELTKSLNYRMNEWERMAIKYETSLNEAHNEIKNLKASKTSSDEALLVLAAEKEALEQQRKSIIEEFQEQLSTKENAAQENLTMLESIIEEKDQLYKYVLSLEADRMKMEETIAQKETEIDMLSKENDKFISKIAVFETSLSETASEYESTISELRSNLELEKETKKNFEDEYQRLMKSATEKEQGLNDTIEELKVSIDSLQKENESLYESNEMLETQKEDLQSILEQKEKDLKRERLEHESHVQSKNNEINSLTVIIKESESEKRGLIISLAEKCILMKNAQRNASGIEENLHEEIDKLRYSESCLIKENQCHERVIGEKNQQIDQLVSQAKSSHADNQIMIITLVEQTLEKNSMSCHISQLTEKLSSNVTAIQTLDEQLTFLQAENQDLKSEIEMKGREFRSAVDCHHSNFEELKSIHQVNLCRLSELENDHNNLIIASVLNASIYRDVRAENMIAISDFEKTVASLQTMNTEANEKIICLQKQCVKLGKDIDEYSANGQENNELLRSTTSQKNELEALLESCNREINALQDEKEQLIQRERLLTRTFVELSERLKRNDESYRNTQVDASFDQEISIEDLNKLIVNASALKDDIVAAHSSNDELRLQNKLLLKDLSEKTSELNHMTTQLNEIKHLNEILSEQKTLSDCLASQISASEDSKMRDIDSLRDVIDLKDKALSELKSSSEIKAAEHIDELQMLKKELDHVQSMQSNLLIDANQKFNKDLEASLERALNEKEKLIVSYQQASTTINTLNDTICDLRNQLNESLLSSTVEKQKSLDALSELVLIQQNLHHSDSISQDSARLSQVEELQQLLAASNAREEEARLAAHVAEEELMNKDRELEEVTLFASECESALKQTEAQLHKLQNELASSSAISRSEAVDEILKEMETLMEEKLDIEKKLIEVENAFKCREDELMQRFEEEQTELLQDAQSRINQLKLVLDDTNIELQRHKDDAAATRCELISLEEHLRSNQTAAIDSDEQVLHLSEQLSTAEAECTRLKEELSKFQEEYDSFVSHSNSTKESLKETYNEKMSNLREEINSLKDSLHEQTLKASLAEEKIIYYDNEISRLKNELKTTKHTLLGEKDIIVSKMKEELALGKVKVSQSEAKVIELMEQLEEYRGQIMNLKKVSLDIESIDKIQARLIIVEKELEEKCSNYSIQTQLVSTLKDTIDKLNVKLESKDERISTLKRKALTKEHVSMIKTLKEERSEYKDLADRYKAEIDRLKSKMMREERNINAEVNLEEFNEMQKKQIALEEKLRKYVAHCEFLKKDKMTLADLIKSTFEDDDSILDKVDEDLGSAIATLCERLKSLEDELASNTDAKHRLMQLESKLATAEGKNSDVEGCLNESNEKIKQLTEEKQNLVAKLHNVSEEVQLLKEKNEKLQKISETVRGSVDEIEQEKKRQISYLEKENLQFLGEMKKMKQELRKLKAESVVASSTYHDDERTEDLGFLTKLVSSSNKENEINVKNSEIQSPLTHKKTTSGLGSGREVINDDNTQECQTS